MKLFTLIAVILFAVPSFAKNIILTPKNVCTLDTQVDAKSMKNLKSCLIRQNSNRGMRRYPLYLVINSPGGSVYAGLDFIRFAKTIRNLHTYTMFAASMGSAIVEHLPGKRYYDGDSIFMFHRAKGSFRGQFGKGEVEKRLKFWTAIIDGMAKKSAARIGITFEDYQAKIKDEWWLYGDESSQVADEKVNVSCSMGLMNAKKVETRRTLFGTFKFTSSTCPLVGRI